jgi:DNA (cytosine-5)-methyltransferase 1
MKVRQLKAIDLFAGAGGLSLAALQCGFTIKAAVEIDGHARNTYRKNLQKRNLEPILIEEDLLEVDWSSILNRCTLEPGECDLLLGGPPCQGFSTHRFKDRGVADPRNRLLGKYFDAIRAILPRTFLVENVSGLLWPRHARYLNAFLKSSRELGYLVQEPITLNARDYGVPQNRKRIFILGVRADEDARIQWPPPPTHFPPELALLAGGKPWKSARATFEKPFRASDPNAIHMKHSHEMIAAFRNTPKDGGSRHESGRILPCHKTHNGHKDVYGRMRLDEPAPTITTGCINPSRGRFVHPTKNHGITLRHAARLQTFPDWFTFEGGLIAGGVQVGNAVPVKLGEALIRSIEHGLRASTR